MSTYRRHLGRLGEEIAAEHLAQHGLHILDRNWRNGRHGELDIIAADPTSNCYVVVEVRTRCGTHCGSGYASVNSKKYRQVRSLATAWLQRQKHKRHVRIDIVSVDFEERIRTLLEHSPDIDTVDNTMYDLHWVQAVSE